MDLVGHSMGGNVVMLYAGVRPERIRRLINLEGFGMPATRPSQAPGRYGQVDGRLKALHRGELDLKAYDDVAGVARRLMKTNPRLGQDKADWLANHWAQPRRRPTVDQWQILGDPAHKIINAQLYRVDEVLEIYRCITAPTLAVEASDDSLGQWWKGKYTLAEYHERLKSVPDCRRAVVTDAGHMLHHDQPGATGRSDGKLPRVRKWRVAARRPLKTAGNSHHGSRTHQPDRHPTHGPERQDRSFTGVSLTSMPNPND